LKRDSGGKRPLSRRSADGRKERFVRVRQFTAGMKRKIIRELPQGRRSPEQIAGQAKRAGIETVSVERTCRLIRRDKREGGFGNAAAAARLKRRKRLAGGKKAIVPERR
jgi:hypothetical protein